MERVVATYEIESPLSIEEAASVLAGEQSSGTFVTLPGETTALKEAFGARIERIEHKETAPAPSLPGGFPPVKGYARAQVDISWPWENFGHNLPTLIATIQGNLYELRQVTGLKLVDLVIPESFSRPFPGPRFGVKGSRQAVGVENRPLIGTIIKPSIGLSPQDTANLVAELAAAGIDFIKDDELMANAPHSSLEQRVDAVMKVINDHAMRTGKRLIYAFNISDEIDAMHRHYDHIVAAGGTCAMFSLNSVGFVAGKSICDRGELIIHGHRNGWGMLNRHPAIGIEFPAYNKLWRLAGVDHMHVNGIDNKFCESNASVVRSIKDCQQAFLQGEPPLPVISSGQWGGQAPETYRLTQTTDLLYQAGGGIMAHPKGPAAGVRSLKLWWHAAVEGLNAERALETYPDLRPSWEKFAPTQ